jgi:hypothetical protein
MAHADLKISTIMVRSGFFNSTLCPTPVKKAISRMQISLFILVLFLLENKMANYTNLMNDAIEKLTVLFLFSSLVKIPLIKSLECPTISETLFASQTTSIGIIRKQCSLSNIQNCINLEIMKESTKLKFLQILTIYVLLVWDQSKFDSRI